MTGRLIPPTPVAGVRVVGDPPSPRPVPKALGWTDADAGRAAYPGTATVYQATTRQICGLFPFSTPAGVPTLGVPIGRHLHSGEVVALDPGEWLREHLISNTGMFVMGQPGIGKSALVKRLMMGLAAYGVRAIVPGDVKGEYSDAVAGLGGSVLRIGRGGDRINPLAAGPLRALAVAAPGGVAAEHVRSRRLALVEALAMLVRRQGLADGERVLLAAAVDQAAIDAGPDRDPIIPDILEVLAAGADHLQAAVYARHPQRYWTHAEGLLHTLRLVVDGPLKGLFDGPSTVELPAGAPAISLDISPLAKEDEIAVAAAMFCSWSWAGALTDAAELMGESATWCLVLDEMWRVLRAAAELVEQIDRLTRLGRQRGVIPILVTHSLDDLNALAKEEDRAKAHGLIDRCAITVLAGLPERELLGVRPVVELSDAEVAMVSRWAAPPTWQPGSAHPGRGRYLIKAGARLGLPVRLTLTATEQQLYDTDRAWHRREAG